MAVYTLAEYGDRYPRPAREFARIIEKHAERKDIPAVILSDDWRSALKKKSEILRTMENLSKFIWGENVEMYSKILLLDLFGNIVARTGERKIIKPTTWWRRKPKQIFVFNPQETVSETLARLASEGEERVWYIWDNDRLVLHVGYRLPVF